jgi:hypothetical protein
MGRLDILRTSCRGSTVLANRLKLALVARVHFVSLRVNAHPVSSSKKIVKFDPI